MLNISKTIYAAWNTNKTTVGLYEAEIIGYGDSVGEKKRLSNLTARYTAVAEHNNVPLPGFTLHASNRKNRGSIDRTWLVIDPRGFLVRISSDNLEDILSVTGITEGLIQQKCVWARNNSQTSLTLIPVNSKDYIEATENTQLLEGKVNINDVQIGDTVLLQNKLTGIYMGVASLYGPLDYAGLSTEYKPQAFLRRQIIKITDKKYYHQSDLKILKVIDKTSTPMTREESVAKMNVDISLPGVFFDSTDNLNTRYYSINGKVNLVTEKASKAIITFEEITKDEAILLFYDARPLGDSGLLLLETLNEKKYILDWPYIPSNKPQPTVDNFEVVRLLPTDLLPTEKIILEDKRRSVFSPVAPACFSIDKFAKFYKIVKSVKNQSYT